MRGLGFGAGVEGITFALFLLVLSGTKIVLLEAIHHQLSNYLTRNAAIETLFVVARRASVHFYYPLPSLDETRTIPGLIVVPAVVVDSQSGRLDLVAVGQFLVQTFWKNLSQLPCIMPSMSPSL